MRHSNNQRKFGRTKNARKALMKGLALSLIKREKILTTEAKAKEIRPYVEKLVTQAKNDSVYIKRLISTKLYDRKVEIKKLFEVLAPKYKDRMGGYTRITKMPKRISDGSPMAYIEFV